MLDRVTITGADDKTNIADLVRISKAYPWIEWGILLSRRHEGGLRFPSRNWQAEFLVAALENKLRISAHLCGVYVRTLLDGSQPFVALPSVAQYAQRIQINTHAEPQVATCGGFYSLRDAKAQIIFQWDGVNDHWLHAARAYDIDAVPLFDKSGGAGIVPDRWPSPLRGLYCGYAGGLGPDNIKVELDKIQETYRRAYGEYSPYRFWIDMERRVRTEDDSRLEIDKVEQVLEAVASEVQR